MDKKSPYIKWMLMAFIIVIVVVGFSTASFISQANIYVARGLLGCAFIYLLYREFSFMSNSSYDVPFDVISTLPNYIRYFVILFGVSILFFLGLYDVIQLVIYIIITYIIKR